MIYLDSTLFLYTLLYPEKEGEKALQFLQHIYGAKLDACTSVLTWDEIVYKLKRLRGQDHALAASQSMVYSQHIVLVPCDKIILQKAHKLMQTYSLLGPRDAIHVATAIHMNCDTIISEDKDFDKIKEIKRKWV